MSMSFEDLIKIASGDLNHYQPIGKRQKRRRRGKQRMIKNSGAYGYLAIKLNTMLTQYQYDRYLEFKYKNYV